MDARPLTIVDAARFAARYWFIALPCFVLFLAPFVYKAFTTPPVYRATLVMVPAESRSQGTGLGAALGQLSGLANAVGMGGLAGSTNEETEEALAVMRSRAFTTAFLEEVEAEDDLARQLGLPSDLPLDNSVKTKAARYFNSSVRSVVLDKKTGLYRLSMDWTDPAAAALWANETVKRLNAVMRARAIERSQANQSYLQKEAARASQVDVRNAVSRLLEAEIRQLMLANVTPEFAFRVVDAATPPELDEKVKPNRRTLVAAGTVFAAFGSLVIVVIIGTLRTRPGRERAA